MNKEKDGYRLEKVTIAEMPDKETLEAFLEGLCGPVVVIFNREKGVFEWIVNREDRVRK